jgi:NAD(P)-dependent dehydrogenase (short-subunit alcohol dehydrogenase family)
MDFTNRVAVVTGGCGGIGGAAAEALAAAGARPVIWDIAPGAEIYCDTAREESIEQALARTVARHGVPSILVAAAGISSVHEPLIDLKVADWDRAFAINARGVMLCYRAVAREMRAAGLDGAMIGVASVNAILSDPYASAYSAAKAALLLLTRIAAVEFGPHGIRVNAIGPGPVDTPMLAPMLASDPGYRTRIEENTPLARLGTPADIAEAILNILGSDWITGQAIMADGGASLLSARGWSAAKARMAATHAADARQGE